MLQQRWLHYPYLIYFKGAISCNENLKVFHGVGLLPSWRGGGRPSSAPSSARDLGQVLAGAVWACFLLVNGGASPLGGCGKWREGGGSTSRGPSSACASHLHPAVICARPHPPPAHGVLHEHSWSGGRFHTGLTPTPL